MEPVNAKYFDLDTGQPLTGANSLPISEVIGNVLRWFKENVTPLDDDEFPHGVGGGTASLFADHGSMSLFDHYDSGCDDPSTPGSGCYMDDDKP